MSEKSAWSIEFYLTDDGKDLIGDFLRGLDDKTQVRFIWSIEQLRVRNLSATEPLVKHIDGKLWELRRASDGNIYRLMYFFFVGRKIVFVHGFQKKTQKTPRSEIEIAQKRMEAYIRRRGGGK